MNKAAKINYCASLETKVYGYFMRIALDKILEKLGVDRVLSPYETQPWFHHDSEKGMTCSAEVRMGPGGDDLEVEIQFLKDETVKSENEQDEEGEKDKEGGEETTGGGHQHIMHMRAEPVTDDQWSPKNLRVKGEDYAGELHNWEEKGCNFFRACIEAMQMGELPDIDELIEAHLSEDGGFGSGKRGRVGRKSPKIKPAQLLGMGKGGGGI